MRYLRHGVLSPGDLPPIAGPDVPSHGEARGALFAAVRESKHSVHLLFLGCHGGDAASESALTRSIEAQSNVADISVCDLCITRAARDRIDALGKHYTTYMFHPAHVLEFLAFQQKNQRFAKQSFIVVSLQEMQLPEFDDTLVYHRLLMVLGKLDIVHNTLFTVRDGSWASDSFSEHANQVVKTRWVVETPRTCTAAGLMK